MYYYIVNPAAGRGTARALLDKLRAELKAFNIGGEFVTTTGAGDATKLAVQAQSKGYTTIVAVGGDETVNEVINGLVDDSAAVGIVPMGSTNQVATQLGIHNWQQACAVLAARRLADYALIAAGSSFFLSSLSIGFENELVQQSAAPTTTLPARLSRLRNTMQHAQNFSSIDCRIEVDDSFTLRAPIFSLSVTNHKFHDQSAPNELIVQLADRPTRRQLSRALWQHKQAASELRDLATTTFRARHITISTEPVTQVRIDGKPLGPTPLAIRLTDRRVRFIVEKQLENIKAHLS